MDIKPLGSVPSRRGPADSFTGTVWQDPIIEAPAPARIRGAFVRRTLDRLSHATTQQEKETVTLALRLGLAEFQNPRHAV